MKSVITGQQSLKENIVEKSMILAQLGMMSHGDIYGMPVKQR